MIICLDRLEGIRGFFRGVVINTIKVIPHAAITFTVYEQIMKILRNSTKFTLL